MRHLLSLLTLIILVTSCKNIEKMVDKGNYDEAIAYAVLKLQGDKNKKTKYVKALERAYQKVNEQDQYQIDYLLTTNSLNRYDKVYDLYMSMQARQKSVMRLDPLVSKDGYVAQFKTEDYIDKLATTAQLATEQHYQEAQRLLTLAVNIDKYAARTAYKRLQYIERYKHSYKDTDQLYIKAYNIGVDHIGVTVDVLDKGYGNTPVQVILSDLDLTQLNKFWTHYHIASQSNIPFDFIATLTIQEIDPGFERELINSFEEYADIEDGQKPVKDRNGNTALDSLGNIIYTTNYRRATARVVETIREKNATLRGKIKVIDERKNSLVQSTPVEISHLFEDYSSIYQGDERALTLTTKNRLKQDCEPFPSDYDMITHLAHEFKHSAYAVLERTNR